MTSRHDSSETEATGTQVSQDFIPLSVPEIRGNEWAYVKECLDTNWVSSAGSFVDRFERSVADYVGTEHAVATINGTAALHIALLVAGVEPDDEVLVSTLTFIAPVNAIKYVGAWPVFMDADEHYWQMDPAKVADFLDHECRWQDGELRNKTTNRRVKAILPVHILGHPCDMDPIVDLAHKYGLVVVEDATESLGARYHGRMVGHLGDIACFSFNGNKLITTGGGGMIVTEQREWAEKALYLTTQAKDDPVEYVHDEIGYNYRLSNINAALGVAQMESIDEYIEKKRAIARVYETGFKNLEGITTMPVQPETEPTHWLYTVLLNGRTSIEERKSVVQALNDNGIGARPFWRPIHTLRPYQDCAAYRIEHSTRLYETGVSLPSSVGLPASDLDRCIAVMRRCLAT